ncbi:hypothetical protein CBS14141_003771 [Malassezia furfur]|nr:hypothetical protein CBS14141_003771 [Malassezia furfur]
MHARSAPRGPPAAAAPDAPVPDVPPLARPLLGGLYATDLLVVSVSLAANLLRTCTLAELLDMVWFGTVYLVFRLAAQMRSRWMLSKRQMRLSGSGAPCFFSVFVLCGARYILMRFPFLLPRVTLAQQTTGPLVQWRTGGAVAHLVAPLAPRAAPRRPIPPFCAYWIRGERRAPATARRRIVVLFVHGGGFALGSVALYTEPLLRMLGHVAKASAGRVRAECVALEYDLVPGVRFPEPLLQCLRCYAHLVEVERIAPEEIVLCGDSAGGGLVLSMLLPVVDVRPHAALVFDGLRQLAAARDLRARKAVARRLLAQGVPSALDFLAPERCCTTRSCTRRAAPPAARPGPAETLRKLLASYAPRPGLLAPVQTLAYYVLRLLSRPVLRGAPRAAHGAPVPAYAGAHTPVVPPAEAQSDAVLPPGPLYRTSALLGVHGAEQTLLATSALVNPALGAWDEVHLARGIYVTYGCNEVLAPDIDAWTTRVRRAWAAADWPAGLDVHVEPGPDGVHVWPFVTMYLAARQSKRERGLRMLAHALLQLYPDEAVEPGTDLSPQIDVDAVEFGSPASMPSDYEEEHTEDRAAQLAWEQELMRLGLRI